jgi:hypothetical protein
MGIFSRRCDFSSSFFPRGHVVTNATFFHPCFTIADCGHVSMLIKGYIKQLCGETPTDLPVGVPAPTTSFVGMTATQTETHRKAAINAPYRCGQDARKQEEWLEVKPQSFLILGINPDTYNAAVWITSQFYCPLNTLWLNLTTQAAIQNTFDSLVYIYVRRRCCPTS